MSIHRLRTSLLNQVVQSLVVITMIAFVTAGCVGGTKLSHNTKNNVFLEEVTDWSYEASHPAVIDQLTIAKILKGLYGNDGTSGSSRMSAGGSKPMRIFNDEDAEFLSPLLAQGLSAAKPEELVGFRLSSSAGSGSEPTTGSIYVMKGAIYLTIGKGAKPTVFLPESAAHAEPAPAYAAGGALDAVAMVIDYGQVAKTPMPAPLTIVKAAPLPSAATMTMAAPPRTPEISDNAMAQESGEGQLTAQQLSELKIAKEILAKKELEISMLRKEADWMKRELRDRAEEMQALRLTKVAAHPAAKKKQAQAARNR
jgi:hypothetical protein